jgi:hypothetical protein
MEQHFTDYVTDTVEDAMDAGVMRRMDPTLAGYAFIAMVSWASRWYRPGGKASVTEIADVFFSIGMDGARSRSDTSGSKRTQPGDDAGRSRPEEEPGNRA